MASCTSTLSWDKALCVSCRQLVDISLFAERGKIIRDTDVAQHPWHDISSAERCAQLPCGLCTLVLASFRKPGYEDWLELLKTWNFRLRARGVSYRETVDLYFVFSAEDSRSLNTETWNEATDVGVGPINFRLMEDIAPTALDSKSLESGGKGMRNHGYLVGGAANVDSKLGKIQAWINQCEVHHSCSPSGRTGGPSYTLPTRLLELGPGEQHPKVKLISGCDLHVQGTKYASLSHCWGKKVLPRLLHENIQAWRSNIPWRVLSKTFQEAIKVTEQLGFSYLWTDALCIIQNSEEDWNREAVLMTDVYSNSSLNIAADASVDGEGGLFRDRHGETTQHFVVPSKDKKGHYILYINGWPDNVEGAPLQGRAWVVQERFLAPRTVHFSQDQLHWECRQLTSSEGLPDHFDLGSYHHLGLQKSAIQLAELSGTTNPESLYRLWYKLVEKYTSVALTYPTDKPIAIAGLAGTFQRYLRVDPSDYLCGLWRPDLLSGLLWCCAGGMRTYDNRIPTWSWLSLDPGTGCWYSLYQLEWCERAQILDASTTPTRNPFGPVSSGNVRLRGPLCQVTISKSEEPLNDGNLKKEEDQLWAYYATARGRSLREEEGFLIKLDEDSEHRLQAVLDQPAFLLLARVAYQDASQASTKARTDHSLHHDSIFECLIVMPAEAQGHFRRIGYLIYEHVWQYGFWKEEGKFKEAVEQAKRSCEILEEAFRSHEFSSELLEEPDHYDGILHTITLL